MGANSGERHVAVGLNSNVEIGGRILHVQTEDLGKDKGVIVTYVFARDGQVIHVARFDYSKHVDHPNLRTILPKAMQSLHWTVIRQLYRDLGDNGEPPAIVTPPPIVIE